MSGYQIPNSVLYGRAKGKNVSKALSDYSFNLLKQRAAQGNKEAARLVKQLGDK